MNRSIRYFVLATGLALCPALVAQTPAGATGSCKDGTYTTNATKRGACAGHKGVKEWYADAGKSTAAAPAASSSASPAPAASTSASSSSSTPASTGSSKGKNSASAAAAPGGGPGQVWLNTETNVYHCQGTRYYGKTKAGSYMSEADAKAKGAKADHGKPCGK